VGVATSISTVPHLKIEVHQPASLNPTKVPYITQLLPVQPDQQSVALPTK